MPSINPTKGTWYGRVQTKQFGEKDGIYNVYSFDIYDCTDLRVNDRGAFPHDPRFLEPVVLVESDLSPVSVSPCDSGNPRLISLRGELDCRIIVPPIGEQVNVAYFVIVVDWKRTEDWRAYVEHPMGVTQER